MTLAEVLRAEKTSKALQPLPDCFWHKAREQIQDLKYSIPGLQGIEKEIALDSLAKDHRAFSALLMRRNDKIVAKAMLDSYRSQLEPNLFEHELEALKAARIAAGEV